MMGVWLGLFRNSSRTTVAAIRQSVLLATMILALVTQSVLGAFIDPVSNASEWTSRAGYVATSLLGLLTALKPSTTALLTGPVLYVYVHELGTTDCSSLLTRRLLFQGVRDKLWIKSL